MVKYSIFAVNDIELFLQRLAELFGVYQTRPYNPKGGRRGRIFCSKLSPTKPLCALLFFLYAGWDSDQLDKVRMLYLSAEPENLAFDGDLLGLGCPRLTVTDATELPRVSRSGNSHWQSGVLLRVCLKIV